MTRRQAVTELRDLFAGAGLEAPRRQAEWILEEVCKLTRIDILNHPDAEVPREGWDTCLKLAERRLSGEPIQYVLGHAEFHGLEFRVTPDVLIPRPETEQLVELLLSRTLHLQHPRVLDVGTGSGCIALTIQFLRPSMRVWACDVDPAALRVAYFNRAAHRLNVPLFQADALRSGFAHAFAGSLDILVSNPPYVSEEERDDLPHEVRAFEPAKALFAPDDPLIFYKRISAEATRVLRPGGFVFFELHEERGGEVAQILEQMGFVDTVLDEDFSGRQRFASACWSGRRMEAS